MEKVFKSSKSEKRALKLLDKNTRKILSIGISTGGSAELNIARKCPQAQIVATTIDEKGLQFSNAQLKNFKEAERIVTKIEDVSKKMPYGDNTFDFIYARLVLHYLTKQQLEKALNEIYRVLKSGGKLFIVARNNKEWELTKPEFIISYNEKTNMTTYYEQWKYEVIRTRQFLSTQQLQEILISHGFKIERCKEYKEYLYTDYERTNKNKSSKPNYLTEVVVTK